MKKFILLFSIILFVNKLNAQCTPSTLPTYNIISTSTLYASGIPGGFTVGCNNHSLTVLSFSNPNTNPIPGGALQFDWIGPGGVTYNGPFITLYIPGTYTAVATDVNTSCQTMSIITIAQNIVSPSILAIVPVQVLDCATPSTVLQGSTSNSNVTFNWHTPTGNVPNVSVTVHTTTNTNSTSAGNYTLSVTDLDNGCISNTVVPMKQNLFPPHAQIYPTSNTLTCMTPSIQLLNASTTSIPLSSGFPIIGPVQTVLWQAPVPQSTASAISGYTAYTPGVYTMTVKDSNNGCTSFTTITIYDACDVGLKEIKRSENLFIYPNPASQILNVELGNMDGKESEIFVYDALGSRIKTEELKTLNGAAQINVSELKRGIYFVKVGNVVGKFLKE